jgi:hypothetical protein
MAKTNITTATSVFFTLISLADNLPSMILREQCYERMNTPTAFRNKFPGKQWEGASETAWRALSLSIAWRQDSHPTKWMKRQQVCTSCENQVCLSINGHFEKLVVARVAAGLNWVWNLHQSHDSSVS